MPDSFVMAGRYLAYQWFRSTNMDAAHEEAWDFAREHWREFVSHSVHTDQDHIGAAVDPPFDVLEEEFDDPIFCAMECEGQAQLLAEK
jgi:hypothetical protein